MHFEGKILKDLKISHIQIRNKLKKIGTTIPFSSWNEKTMIESKNVMF